MQPENLVFTACTGRCGQSTLAAYLNAYGQDCLAEVEPPDLIYKAHWPLGSWLRIAQRKWIVTHEDLGRGRALGWHDNDQAEPLRRLAARRLARIGRLCRKRRARTYVELSKFFIRSYCDAVHAERPDLGVLLLYRDPLKNARSFVNRNKDFALDGVMPHFRKACLRLDQGRLTPYQLYLWQWVEIALRYRRFVEQHGVARHLEFPTEDLNHPARVEALFRHFGIPAKAPVERIRPRNTNQSQGRAQTAVTVQDLAEFDRFLDLLPPGLVDGFPHLLEYRRAYEGLKAGA